MKKGNVIAFVLVFIIVLSMISSSIILRMNQRSININHYKIENVSFKKGLSILEVLGSIVIIGLLITTSTFLITSTTNQEKIMNDELINNYYLNEAVAVYNSVINDQNSEYKIKEYNNYNKLNSIDKKYNNVYFISFDENSELILNDSYNPKDISNYFNEEKQNYTNNADNTKEAVFAYFINKDKYYYILEEIYE